MMLTGFQENSDGFIYVRNNGIVYRDTRANFQTDFGRTLAALPNGVTQRLYVPGVRHALSDSVSVVAGGPMPWTFGDDAIAAVATLIAAQTTRNAPPPPTTSVPVISDRQFFQAIAMQGLISQEEALAAVSIGTIPPPMSGVIDAIPDEDDKFAAKMLLSGAVEFQRHHPLVEVFGAANGMSATDLDNLWTYAATL